MGFISHFFCYLFFCFYICGMNTEEKYNLIDDKVKNKIVSILSNFDFHRVRLTMEKLDWRWATLSGVRQPTIEDMIRCAHELMVDAVFRSTSNNTKYCVGTGGFSVEAFWDSDTRRVTGVSLQFVVSEWDEFIED
jgi:hypothetical protein